MGTSVIGPRKVARYRRETGLEIVAAYTIGGSHVKELFLADGRVVLRHPSGEIEATGDLWYRTADGSDRVSTYLARYWQKAGRSEAKS